MLSARMILTFFVGCFLTQNILVFFACRLLLSFTLGFKLGLTRYVFIPLVLEERLARFAFNGFALKQHARHQVHLFRIVLQNGKRTVIRFIKQARHFLVDKLHRFA